MVKFTMKNFAGPKANAPLARKLASDRWPFDPSIISLHFSVMIFTILQYRRLKVKLLLLFSAK